MIVKRSGKISVAGAVMVVSWGFCYGWRRFARGRQNAGPGDVSGGMAEFRGATGTFAIGTDAFVIGGVLPAVARSPGVSTSSAGLLVTAFAVAYALGAPILAVVGARLARRTPLVSALAVFVAAHVLAAVAPSYALVLIARVLAALAAAAFVPAASAVASSLAPDGVSRPGTGHSRRRHDRRPGGGRPVRRIRRGVAWLAIHVHLRRRPGRRGSPGSQIVATARPIARARLAWPGA